MFDAFRQKDSSKEIARLRDELSKQDKWIRHLHEYSRDLHSYTSEIKRSNVSHKKEIMEHVVGMTRWIEYLNDSHNSMKREISGLRNSLKRALREDFEIYHKTLMEYLDMKLKDAKAETENLKEEMRQELRARMDALRPEIPASGSSTNMLYEKEYVPSVELTNPEKELLSLLFNENKPMTYEELAQKLNKSINSVRVYMNSLKSKKDIIDEFMASSGSKIFSIKNSEFVRTLYNLN